MTEKVKALYKAAACLDAALYKALTFSVSWAPFSTQYLTRSVSSWTFTSLPAAIGL